VDRQDGGADARVCRGSARHLGFIDTIQSNLELADEEVQYQIIRDIEAI
jgi:hypothetical protein